MESLLMARLRQIDRALMALIVASLIAAVGIYLWDKPYFSNSFAVEDGPVEYGTALFLLISSLVLIRNAAALTARQRIAATLLTAFYALMFFAAAGEEISWGQRIFGWESGQFFQDNNNQSETNLHNMIVGNLSLTRTLFGSTLTVAILLYLVGLPLLYPRVPRIARIADRLAIPVPGLRHAVFALAASLIIGVIDVRRKWEVYELVFSLMTVSVFLLPQNRDRIT